MQTEEAFDKEKQQTGWLALLTAGPVPLWRSILILAVLVALSPYFFSGRSASREGQKGIVMYLPPIMGSFDSKLGTISPAELRVLPNDTALVRREYVNNRGLRLNAALILAGGEQRSIHRPHVCLIAQGWRIRSDKYSAMAAGGLRLPVRNLHLVREVPTGRDDKTVQLEAIYTYWYIGHNYATNDEYARIWTASWDLAMKDVNHRWAYCSLLMIVPGSVSPGGANAEKTQEFLNQFAASLAPHFQLSIMPPQERDMALRLEAAEQPETILQARERMAAKNKKEQQKEAESDG